jgi:hypothetical protein
MNNDQAVRLIDVLRRIARRIPSQGESFAEISEETELNRQIDDLAVSLVGWSCDCNNRHTFDSAADFKLKACR